MLNKCEFIGNVCADPELRYTSQGTAVASFTLACTERYKDRDGNKQEDTEFVRVVAWGRLGEVCAEYLHKGSRAYISGKQKTRKWQDQNNNDRYTTEIIAKEMLMLDRREDSGQSQNEGSSGHGYGGGPTVGEDVPFIYSI